MDEGADIDSDPDLVKEAKGFLVTPFVAVDAVMGVCIIHYSELIVTVKSSSPKLVILHPEIVFLDNIIKMFNVNIAAVKLK